jgi:hypothetical protein
MASVRALTYVDTWMLTRDAFLKCCALFPAFLEKIKVELVKRNVDIATFERQLNRALDERIPDVEPAGLGAHEFPSIMIGHSSFLVHNDDAHDGGGPQSQRSPMRSPMRTPAQTAALGGSLTARPGGSLTARPVPFLSFSSAGDSSFRTRNSSMRSSVFPSRNASLAPPGTPLEVPHRTAAAAEPRALDPQARVASALMVPTGEYNYPRTVSVEPPRLAAVESGEYSYPRVVSVDPRSALLVPATGAPDGRSAFGEPRAASLDPRSLDATRRNASLPHELE